MTKKGYQKFVRMKRKYSSGKCFRNIFS